MSLKRSFNYFASLFLIFFFSVTFYSTSFSQNKDQQAAAGGGANAEVIAKGEKLFSANCTSCHAIDAVVVGPALRGVDKRRQIGWITNFVHNSQKVIASGDQYAVDLYNKFNKTQMTSFPQLTDDDVKSIVEYIKSVPEPVKDSGKKEASSTTGTTGGEGTGNNPLVLGLVIVTLILVLVTLIVFLRVISRYLKDREANLAEADREVVNQKYDVKKALTSKVFLTIVGVLFVGLSLKACWQGLFLVGVEQGYAPEQPIPFSHKLHAGDNKIDCNYCHTGVTKGKQANIPSLNICMNCHSQIKSGPRFKEAGIKILLDHYESNKPVKWIRIHNLPDLAYFNHSQHVKVGGIECKQCHGPVDTMEVVRQVSPLTMGWCIDCHRNTNIKGKDNAYYDKLMQVHAKKGSKEIKVAEVGGLECSKCHY